jgi:hypothetical protein
MFKKILIADRGDYAEGVAAQARARATPQPHRIACAAGRN